MRGYFLTNMYLSPIQRGIQSAHCMHDMFVTYSRHDKSPAYDKLWTWAEHHKTMIVLNGGTSEELQEVFDFLMRDIEDYPFDKFHEPGIGDALTCVGVVLTQLMIDGMKHVRENPTSETCCVYQDPSIIGATFVQPQIQVVAEQRGESEHSLLSTNLEPVYTPTEWELCRMLAHKSLA